MSELDLETSPIPMLMENSLEISGHENDTPVGDPPPVSEDLVGSFASATSKKSAESTPNAVTVMVRVRPLSEREKNCEEGGLPVTHVSEGSVISVLDPPLCEKVKESFTFERVFNHLNPMGKTPLEMQREVFEAAGLPALEAALSGRNSCVFAYGQTGSGKTYTMLGCPELPGLTPQLAAALFKEIEMEDDPTVGYSIETSFFEIYNEKVRDLLAEQKPSMMSPKTGLVRGRSTVDPGMLSPDAMSPKNNSFGSPMNKSRSVRGRDVPPPELKVRHTPETGTYVEGLSKTLVRDEEDVEQVMEEAQSKRAVTATALNDVSSRSHAVFQIHILRKDACRGIQTKATINLVDLAGSERTKRSQVTGAALQEANKINLSLSTLRRVIDALMENATANVKRKQIVPYRDSVLTWVLADSIGGNSVTTMLANASPHASNADDTINTLRYAAKAKSIVCFVKVNLSSTEKTVNAIKTEISLLRSRLRASISAPTEDISAEDAKRLEAEIIEKERVFASMSEKRGESAMRADELKNAVQEKKNLIMQLQDRLEAKITAGEEKAKVEAELQVAQSGMSQLKGSLEAQLNEIAETEHEITRQAELTKDIRNARDVKDAIAKAAEQKQKETRQRTIADIFRVATTIGDNQRQVTHMRKLIDRDTKRLSKATVKVPLVVQETVQKRSDVVQLRDIVSEAERQSDEICNEYEKTIAYRSSCIKTIQDWLGVTDKSLNQTQNEVDRLVSRIEEIQSLIEDVQNANHKTERTLGLEVAELSEKLSRATHDIEGTTAEYERTVSAESSMDSRVNMLRSELEGVRAKEETLVDLLMMASDAHEEQEMGLERDLAEEHDIEEEMVHLLDEISRIQANDERVRADHKMLQTYLSHRFTPVVVSPAKHQDPMAGGVSPGVRSTIRRGVQPK